MELQIRNIFKIINFKYIYSIVLETIKNNNYEGL